MSGLQNKLYNYEQTPPEKVWDKIAAALDDSHIDDKFPSKLYDTEVMPPQGAWDRIATSLEAEHASVIPMTRRSFPLFRYAAAAVIIGLVAFGAIKWMGGNNDKTDNSIARSADTTTNTKKADLSNEKKAEDSNKQPEISTTPGNSVDITEAGLANTSPVKKVKNRYTVAGDTDVIDPIYAYNEHTPNLADRYIMLMTPGGDIIRMSKKWGSLVCCVSGQEQDPDCKDQLKKLQEKLACSPVATSNFMDILSLVSTLNETEL